MKATPIYIQQIEVENIKTFEQCTTLSLARPDKTISQWTLLLGDNSVGKSTLLQLIAWMKPVLPYDILDVPKDFVPAPMINDEENEVLESLVRKRSSQGQMAHIRAVFVADQKLDKAIELPLNTCETKMAIGVNNVGKLEHVESDFDTKKEGVFYRDEVAIYAYSASRQLGHLNLSNPKLEDTIPGFIQEKTELYDAEEILHTLHYASLGSKSDAEKEKYKRFTNTIKAMLVTLLPDFERIEDIEINPPNPLSHDAGGIIVNTKHGEKIPFADFSLGYKTVTSWTIDLAWRLFNKHHDKVVNPLQEPAIVLIDEIDLHLHPRWQREIMASLTLHFPNIQFIASAHSPLMVQAAIRSNYAVLKFDEDSVRIENEPEGIEGWRVDQILTSELFGLKSARGAEYDSLLEKRDALLQKDKLTGKEKAELNKITKKLIELPTGENPAENNEQKVISNFVQQLKDSNFKISL